ncbi:unnamed protein product [Diamesa serratosioi]
MNDLGCKVDEKVSIVIHGWKESIEAEWVPVLIRNLQHYRGGCVIFMDYSAHSMVFDYFELLSKFDSIGDILIRKLLLLEKEGFAPDNIYIFGFSFGAHLALYSGITFGDGRIGEIDVCDPAGPGFDRFVSINPMLAAKNVQCIHTSIRKGTTKRNCHQDWMMGQCGIKQDGAGPSPKGNHGLCPHFYNSAFENNFFAIENIYNCRSLRTAQNIPPYFKMGYMETRKNEVLGDLFSPTAECYPYNYNENDTISSKIASPRGSFSNMVERISLLFLTLLCVNTVQCGLLDFRLKFIVFTNNGNTFVSTWSDDFKSLGCDPSEKMAFFTHGYRESINSKWVTDLVINLRTYRGGCIIFMDYSNHSTIPFYTILVEKFYQIVTVMMRKLRQLEAQGFDFGQMYMFGFSYGAQLVLRAGVLLGVGRVGEIDVCDPAGIGFDTKYILVDPTWAAKNVQCIHTSIISFTGTSRKSCHQNWLMGYCGVSQEASNLIPVSSHSLCPIFYNSAFNNNFYATQQNPNQCIASYKPAQYVPKDFKMGYQETRKSENWCTVPKMKFICVVVIISFTAVNCQVTQPINDESITFRVLPSTGDSFNLTSNVILADKGCNPREKFAIIVHGWLESYAKTEWVPDLIGNLTLERGGCIIFMDYSNFSINPDYFYLVTQFPNISNVLLTKLNQLKEQGFDPDKGYMFGFSYGAHLIIDAATKFGQNLIKDIDLCDPAGPGFDGTLTTGDPKLAAKNVQCIHTSNDKGTIKRDCHQNWLMGYCGFFQFAAGAYPKGSHGLCPYFYNTAFKYDFLATNNTYGCYSARPTTVYPEFFRMGYNENRKNKVFGDLFSPTAFVYPYNFTP